MLFRRTAPFEVYAISKRSPWFHGHLAVGGERVFAAAEHTTPGKPSKREIQEDGAEMYFVMSMNWNIPGGSYHGYLDDPIFIGWGIEDIRAGAIDVLAGDLLQDLSFCADVVAKG